MIPEEDKIILSKNEISDNINYLMNKAQNIISSESDSWRYWRCIGMVNVFQSILNGEDIKEYLNSENIEE